MISNTISIDGLPDKQMNPFFSHSGEMKGKYLMFL
jgi:hypothetical protein